jgi:hypothetical protein
MTPVTHYVPLEIDLGSLVTDRMFQDQDRLRIVHAVLDSIQSEGTIAKIRALVSDPKWDDTAPAPKGPVT